MFSTSGHVAEQRRSSLMSTEPEATKAALMAAAVNDLVEIGLGDDPDSN